LGIGSRLVAECTRFAIQARYRKIMLWTNTVLRGARHIYEKAGYVLVSEKPHHSFGHDLIAQTWELQLKNYEGRSVEVTSAEMRDDAVSLS